jgi:hypothetical protein
MGASQGDQDTRRRKLFLQKPAGSITEIQPIVSSVDEVTVLPEVLGCDDKNAVRNCPNDLQDIAKGVFDFTTFYDTRQPLQHAEGPAIKGATRPRPRCT